MAVTSARSIVSLKDKGHFEHKNENEKTNKYTLSDELPSRLQSLQLVMQPGFTIRVLTTDDKDAVLKFMNRFFCRDEPMNYAVKLLETPDSTCVEIDEYAAKTLGEEVSVAAVDEAGEFVGIIINGIVRREDVDYTDHSADCPNEKFRMILRVLGHLDREARIWDKLPASCQSVMEVRIASTHPDWRGRGLMRALCEESERLAKSAGAGAMRMDTTSAFSALAATRLGYKQVYSVPYSDLPFGPQPDHPHLEARVYIKQLD